MTRTAADMSAVRPLVDFLIAERHANNLSQYALAERLGCKQSQVAAWEKGRNAPGVEFLAAWGAQFGYALAFIPEDGQ